MSHAATKSVWDIRGISLTQKVVLLCLADHADQDMRCFPSLARIADQTCMSPRAAWQALRELEKAGLIKTEGRGRNQSNVYTLDLASHATAPSASNAGDAIAPDANMEPDAIAPSASNASSSRGLRTSFQRASHVVHEGIAGRANEPVIEPVKEPVKRTLFAVGHTPPPHPVGLSGQSQPRQESQQGALIPEALASPKQAPERSRKPRKAPEPTRVALAWRAYCAAIAERYPGEDPVWNPKMGGIFGNLVKQLGDAAAPVAVFYVKHNHRTYIEKKHVPEYLILNATTLHREWQAGEAMTATRAQQAERTASNPFLEELAERRRARAAADQIECQVEGDNVSGKR